MILFNTFSGYPFFPKELNTEKDTPKLIIVAINEQYAATYEFGKLTCCFPISSGTEKGLTPERVIEEKGLHPTPRGRFKIFYKNRNHRSSIYPEPTGGHLMPYTLMFTQRGHAFHAWGDLQHPPPGYPNSHGCINLFIKDAKQLFDWAKIGTEVLIVDFLKNKKHL